MTILVRDDFTGFAAGSIIDQTKWSDTVTNFYQTQPVAHSLKIDTGGVCTPDITGLAIDDTGQGEAITIALATVANQYVEAGINCVLGDGFDGIARTRVGNMILGLRLTGGSGAIEGITASFHLLSDYTTSVFTVQQTHSTVQTFIGPALGVNVNAGLTFVVRLEVTGSTVALKVNGTTIITGATTVTQTGRAYMFVRTDVFLVVPAPEDIGGYVGSFNKIDYFEYGEVTNALVNNVAVSGGGSPGASAMDSTNILPPLPPPPESGRMFFTLDSNGSGAGTSVQRFNNTAMTVGSRLAISTGSGVIGGVEDSTKTLYIPVSGFPSKVWKVDGAAFTELAIQTLGQTSLNPYPQLDTSGNVYFVGYASGNTVVQRVRCSDLAILNTLTPAGYSFANIKGWDGVGIDNGRGYLYVAVQALANLSVFRIALGSFTISSTITGFSSFTVCNAIFINGSYLYLCGGDGDIVGDPANAHWKIYRENLDVPSATYLTGLASNVITCAALDVAHSKAYFGNYEFSPGHGRITRVDLASFTIDMTVDFGAGSGPIRSLYVDATNVYAAMAPAAHGGATWWLMKTDLNLASPTFVTDATWTGTAPVLGAKTIMFA